jgi:methyltransferase (TIGR00027 family)
VALSGLALTAKMTAAARALECRRADRLFDDPLAAMLAGKSGFALLERWRLPGAPLQDPLVGPRTRFFDDLVVEAVAGGIRQVVILASGMDTRAFRLALPADTVLFELDLPQLHAEKSALLRGAGVDPRCRRVVVGGDLESSAWPQVLVAAGLEPSAPSVFLLESLSWCLSERSLVCILDAAASLAPAASRLGIDILSSDFLRNPELLPLLELATAHGVYWQFGTNDPVRFLAARGWTAAALDALALGERYGRRPPAPLTHGPAAAATVVAPQYVLSADRA